VSGDVTITGIGYPTSGTLLPNTSDYSVIEDATPLDPSDTTGGTGTFTFGVSDQGVTPAFRGRTAQLADGAQGTTTGTINSEQSDGTTITVSADSRLIALNVVRTAQPYAGTLSGAFNYYLSLVNITSGILIDSSIASTPVVVPGWSGNVWDKIRSFAAVYQFEVSLVSNNIVARAPRQRIAQNYRDSQETWSITNNNIARAVEVYYYQAQQQTAALAYPLGGWNASVQPLQVNAGEVLTTTLPLAPSAGSAGLIASLSSVSQPTAVDSVDRYYTASSVYCVAGNDGLPIPAAQWLAGGGNLTVAISPDTRSLVVTITGSSVTQYAPYRIGMSSGTSNFYSSLRIVGNGVFGNKVLARFDTGNTIDQAPTEVGATIDSEFINSYLDAVRVGRAAVARYCGPTHTISVTTTGINKANDPNSLAYPTMGQFNADSDFAGKTMAQFNAQFSGWTLKQFNDYEFAKVANNFENQAFGNVSGARVFWRNSYFRIRTATIGPGSLQYTAERDTMMSDFNTAAAGMTMAQFNALHAGETMGDFNAAPLRVS
jgi:hypothetical protein